MRSNAHNFGCHINKHCSASLPIVLVVNKCDPPIPLSSANVLTNDSSWSSSTSIAERVITRQQIAEFADRLKLPWLECSARYGNGVMESFQRLASLMVAQEPYHSSLPTHRVAPTSIVGSGSINGIASAATEVTTSRLPQLALEHEVQTLRIATYAVTSSSFMSFLYRIAWRFGYVTAKNVHRVVVRSGRWINTLHVVPVQPKSHK
jgi:hypothetical protein